MSARRSSGPKIRSAGPNATSRRRPSTNPLPLPSPLHQGALDGLCSLYSIINALRLLHGPAITAGLSRSLFETLFESLAARLGPSESLCRGAEPEDLSALLRKVQKTLRAETNIRISISTIRLPRERRRLDVLWSLLRERIDSGEIAIIGLAGHHAHWTVGYRATEKSIRLFDSDGLRVLVRRHCSLRENRRRHLLIPEDIFVVGRERRKRT